MTTLENFLIFFCDKFVTKFASLIGGRECVNSLSHRGIEVIRCGNFLGRWDYVLNIDSTRVNICLSVATTN